MSTYARPCKSADSHHSAGFLRTHARNYVLLLHGGSDHLIQAMLSLSKNTHGTARPVCHTLCFVLHSRAYVHVSRFVGAWSAWTRVDEFSMCWTVRVFYKKRRLRHAFTCYAASCVATRQSPKNNTAVIAAQRSLSPKYNILSFFFIVFSYPSRLQFRLLI